MIIKIEKIIPEIIESNEIDVIGKYVVMEGEVVFFKKYGESTQYWVEKEGCRFSEFGDIDYASVMAKMLDLSEKGGFLKGEVRGIGLAAQSKLYTILSGFFFGRKKIFWITDKCGFNVEKTELYIDEYICQKVFFDLSSVAWCK